jgi:hypothetical protein
MHAWQRGVAAVPEVYLNGDTCRLKVAYRNGASVPQYAHIPILFREPNKHDHRCP